MNTNESLHLQSRVPLNNGVMMPWVGLGVFLSKKGDETRQAVSCALEVGYRHIDTAMIYENEEDVGHAIAASGVPRNELFITSKLWNDDRTYERTRPAFEATMERLGLEVLDLYLIHWPGKDDSFVGAWKVMEELLAEGRVRAIGVSNFYAQHLTRLAKDASVVPAVNQIEFHPRLQQASVVDYCQAHGIQVESWSPLMRGRILDDPTLQVIAKKYGKTVAQIILRWNLQRDIVIIPKSVHDNRIRENSELFDFALSDAEVERINQMDESGRIGPDPEKFG